MYIYKTIPSNWDNFRQQIIQKAERRFKLLAKNSNRILRMIESFKYILNCNYIFDAA